MTSAYGLGWLFGATSFRLKLAQGANIQDNSVVHVTGGRARTTLGQDVTVGHMAMVHGATVGDGCLVGMGAILLDGCDIGAESVVGAGSLVTEGAAFPQSLLLGRPARRVRELTDEDMSWVKRPAGLYVRHAKTYRDEVFEV